MFIIVALGFVALVAILHHASQPTSGEAGTSNGVDINATQPAGQNLTSNGAAIGLYGTTGSPSPMTGAGSPSSNNEYKAILFLQKNPTGSSRFNALQHSPVNYGTGLLDPLPDKGTRSKELLTKDVLVRGGHKV